MPLSAEEANALAEDSVTEETTVDETDTSAEEGVAEGEQAGTEETVEATEEETPAEPEKPAAEQPKGWRAVEAAKRAQLQAAQARQTVAAREAQIAEREQRYESQVQQLQAYERQLSARAAKLQTFERAIESGDIEALEKTFGLSYERLTRAAIEAQDPNVRVTKLERELAEQRKREEADRQSHAQVQETRQIAQNLVSFVEDAPDEFPDLYMWPPERIADEGVGLRNSYLRKYGRQPTYDQVMTELQRRAKSEADARTQRQQRLEQRKSPNASAAGSAGKQDPKGASGSPTTPALSSKTAVVRATPPRQKTDEETDEECLSMLRGLKR